MIKFQMGKPKETKWTYVYAAKGEDGEQIAPSIYIKKGAFPGAKVPDTITATIEG